MKQTNQPSYNESLGTILLELYPFTPYIELSMSQLKYKYAEFYHERNRVKQYKQDKGLSTDTPWMDKQIDELNKLIHQI